MYLDNATVLFSWFGQKGRRNYPGLNYDGFLILVLDMSVNLFILFYLQ